MAEDYTAKLKYELVDLADRRGVDSSGTKDDIIARLEAQDNATPPVVAPEPEPMVAAEQELPAEESPEPDAADRSGPDYTGYSEQHAAERAESVATPYVSDEDLQNRIDNASGSPTQEGTA